MTIKLAEDLLDFPHRYPELFKSHMVRLVYFIRNNISLLRSHRYPYADCL